MKHKIIGTRENVLRAIDNSIVGYKSKRNREILKDHYVEGMTFEDVAEKYKMSTWQAKNICYSREPIINAYLKGEL